VLNSLAIGLYRQQWFEEALGHLHAALAIYTALDQRPYAAMVMNNIGENLTHLKRYDEALAHLRRALAIRHETSDRYGEAITEAALGDTCLDGGAAGAGSRAGSRASIRWCRSWRWPPGSVPSSSMSTWRVCRYTDSASASRPDW
jgi:tetratricopeptide (TPR) repeat protein